MRDKGKESVNIQIHRGVKNCCLDSQFYDNCAEPAMAAISQLTGLIPSWADL